VAGPQLEVVGARRVNKNLRRAVTRQRTVISALDAQLKNAVEVLQLICPHEHYETLSDPTCHQCLLCKAYLVTDEADGTGEVLEPRRAWE